ncbi:unnamed protein product [Rodentolepis nana]|uniref:GCM domain-containing protein n=1 Tax=Rodentolepis nana TaxID=102285 RepID=A0A0R3T113_RODNA|nr:unnamed protein product [Rodentolepis nana]
MRNSNNHNIDILKKSCVGVHLCTSCRAYVYPAISEVARKSQTNCPLKYCEGKLLYMPCKGNRGHPVTHSWRRVGKSLFFEAKGTHDHPKPVVKVSRVRKRRKDSCSQMNIEMPSQESLTLSSSSTCLPNAMPFPHSIRKLL